MPLPRWIAPANPRRVWILLAIGTILIAWRLLAAQGYLEWNPRLHDKLHALTNDDRRKFNAVLGWLYEENGVDAHVELLPEIGGEPLEQYTVRRMRELGMGRESGRRGLLLVYDRSSARLRIEVGPALEGLLTDAFVGHINRESLQHYVSADNLRDGLYATHFMILDRLRQAALGNDFDPRVLALVEDGRRLSLGAGQTTRIGFDGGSDSFGTRSATPAEREYFAPQPTVKAAFERFHQWLAYGGEPHDVPLFTATSVEWFDESPSTRAFSEMWLMQEYGRAYRIEERGKLAMLFFTDSPFAQPHFFRKGKAGWQLDLIGELLNTRNTIGGRYSWVLWESGDDFFRTFRERFVEYNSVLRLAGADNRELPMSGDDSTVQVHEPLPIARTDSAMEHLTVIEAAERIRAGRGRPTLVMLYHTTGEYARTALPWLAILADSLRGSGVEVLAFSIDQADEVLRELPDRLGQAGAPFAPVHLYRWWPGMLDSSMATAGVTVGREWDAPLVALLAPDGQLVGETQGSVPSASRLIERLRARRAPAGK
jgi:TLP18.3/Psb32/MOLO-1 phosphatase superfamily protein